MSDQYDDATPPATETLSEETPKTTEKKPIVYSDEEVQEIMKKRVAQERKSSERAAEQERQKFEAKIAELEKKVNAGTASMDEQAQHQKAKNTIEEGQQQGLSPEQLQYQVQEQMKMQTLDQKFTEAKSKDPEFAKLWDEGNQINSAIFPAMAHLDKPEMVLKHLLKDKKAHNMMQLAASGGLRDFTQFIDDLEDKLMANSQNTPRPPNYPKIPDFSNAGDTDQDFDLEDYVKNYKK